MPVAISHYCQKCLAPNPLGQDFCLRCGTRLMIVVEPSSARFEIGEQAIPTDEHLLERISFVENRLSKLTERLERSLDLLLRQAQNSYFDRSLVKTLIGLLTEDGLVETTKLEQLWNDRCEQEALEKQQSSQRDEVRLKILATPPKTDSKAFADLVGEGFLAFADKQNEVGIDKLQRAAEMTDSNSSLNMFIAEHYFRSGKTRIARTYLTKVHAAIPEDVRVSLLLGLTCADDGDVATAKKLLSKAMEKGGSCFAGHYGLGWLNLLENKRRKAVTHFKRALEANPSPEAHFALASLYYELERYELATRHLNQAIEMDGKYQQAYYLLALIYQRIGKDELVEATLSRCGAISRLQKSSNSRASSSSSRLRTTSLTTGLMTGADRRLASALREDALRAFLQTGQNSR
jgi:tetratricopeptide (TPR) repeat protein